jgi:hypothetical protein
MGALPDRRLNRSTFTAESRTDPTCPDLKRQTIAEINAPHQAGKEEQKGTQVSLLRKAGISELRILSLAAN